METKILKKLGLNENEVSIYLALLRKGACIASEIAELTKLHRTHVYDLLESLSRKGVVSFSIKDNKKYFQAVEPIKLEVLLKRKEEELGEDKQELGKLIKELSNLGTESKRKLLASIYEGKQSFMSQLNDIIRTLSKGEEYLVLGFTGKADDTLKYFLPGFGKRRVEKGIRRRVIMDIGLRGSESSKQKLQETRYLPKEYKIPMGIVVYKNIVVLVIIEDDYLSLRIDNNKIADNFRKYFELIWRQARK